MYCQISIIKPSAIQKERIAETFSQKQPTSLQTENTVIPISDFRYDQKRNFTQCTCSIQNRQDMLTFCRNLHRYLGYTRVQLVTMTSGRKRNHYTVTNFRKDKGKLSSAGCCSTDWTVRDLIRLQILENEISGFYS